MRSPYIHETKTEYHIIGSKEALAALGEMLIMKAKMGRRLSATFSDGTNKPIKILTDEDILDDFDAIEKERNKDGTGS